MTPATASDVEKRVASVNRTHLAARLGLTRNYVSLVLGGKRSPSFSVAVEMAKKVGVGLEEFQGYLERAGTGTVN